MSFRLFAGALSLTVMIAAPASWGAVFYVDDDAPAGGNGQSWSTAYVFLQDALAAASSSPGSNEIRVARGIYRPDRGSGKTLGDRNASFKLLNNLTLKGAYAGLGAPNPDLRNIVAHETILSGDLAGNDGANFQNYAENAYHVVQSSASTATATLDGLTITSGFANGTSGLAT